LRLHTIECHGPRQLDELTGAHASLGGRIARPSMLCDNRRD
jgi:hypothetical protein